MKRRLALSLCLTLLAPSAFATEPASFLLPAPNSGRTMVALYSAPVLDPSSIRDAAEQSEADSRATLRARQTELVQRLCALDSEEARKNEIATLRIRLSRERIRWMAMQNRVERSVAYRIRQSRPQAESGAILAAREPVIVLMRERQELVLGAWTALLDAIEDESDPEDCQAIVPAPIEENLFWPVHIARLRFYRLLPLEARLELVLFLYGSRSN